MMGKRYFYLPLLAALLALAMFLTYPVSAQDEDFVEIDGRTQRAIERGLAYLAKEQRPDGSWTDIIGRKVNDMYQGRYGVHVGVTALCGIAFLAGGYLPGRGKYGENVRRVVDFFVDNFASPEKSPNGFISLNESRMYSHAFVTLFLAEIYGMTHREELRTLLKRAVRLIERSQNAQGGWRYLPTSQDSDLSIVVCQLMALRAARNAGISVDPEVIRRAIRYVLKSYIANRTMNYQYRPVQYGFWYQCYNLPSRTSYALTAAGVASLFAVSEGRGLVDARTRQEIQRAIRGGLNYLLDPYNRPPAHHMSTTFDYFYAQYYAAQAMYQAGLHYGSHYWRRWYSRVRDEIVRGQRPDGSWEDLVGPHYATAMATLILQIPYRYLPIFQR